MSVKGFPDLSNSYLIPCNLCGGTEFVLLFEGNIKGRKPDRFSQYAWYDDIYRCTGCSLVVERLDLDAAELNALIENEKYLDEPVGVLNIREKHLQFETLLRIMEKHSKLPDAHVVDVGANTGVFMNAARARGMIVDGIEPSHEACEAAKQVFGLTVQNSDIKNAKFCEETYDCITLWDVIEHLYDPKGDLVSLLPALKRGGKIYISTHDIETRFAQVTGRHYPMLMYQHLYHFSKRTLGEMLSRCGYEVLATEPFYKSWSLPYVLSLADKNWPGSAIGGIGRRLSEYAAQSHSLSKFRLAMPLREFFVIIARRPL